MEIPKILPKTNTKTIKFVHKDDNKVDNNDSNIEYYYKYNDFNKDCNIKTDTLTTKTPMQPSPLATEPTITTSMTTRTMKRRQ